MDQRVGVYRLHRRGHTGHRRRPAAHRAVRGEEERRADPLPGRGEGVGERIAVPAGHLAAEPLRPLIENAVGQLAGLGEEVHG